MTFEPFDVVVVPFPFTDRNATKRRPALVLSHEKFQAKIGHSVLAMITSAENANWPLDTKIKDLKTAGLPSESKLRMKLFTLDDSLIIRKTGSLSKTDRRSVLENLKYLFGLT